MRWEMPTEIWSERDNAEDLGVDGRRILEWVNTAVNVWGP